MKPSVNRSKGTFHFVPCLADGYINTLLSFRQLTSPYAFVHDTTLEPVSYTHLETKFGVVYPTTEDIARAIAERDNAEILPTGSTALNMLGLSEQVTMTPVFLTSGSARKIKCGNKTITFKRGVPKNFALKGKVTRLLVQAMKAIGERNYNGEWESAINVIVSKYPEDDTMSEDLKVMPDVYKRQQ